MKRNRGRDAVWRERTQTQTREKLTVGVTVVVRLATAKLVASGVLLALRVVCVGASGGVAPGVLDALALLIMMVRHADTDRSASVAVAAHLIFGGRAAGVVASGPRVGNTGVRTREDHTRKATRLGDSSHGKV